MTNETPREAALRVWDKHQLNDRAAEPMDGAVLLLKQASEALWFAWMTLFEQQAVTPDILQIARDAAMMTEDACVLAAADRRTVPVVGTVERIPGTDEYLWRPSKADRKSR